LNQRGGKKENQKRNQKKGGFDSAWKETGWEKGKKSVLPCKQKEKGRKEGKPRPAHRRAGSCAAGGEKEKKKKKSSKLLYVFVKRKGKVLWSPKKKKNNPDPVHERERRKRALRKPVDKSRVSSGKKTGQWEGKKKRRQTYPLTRESK